MTAMDHLVHVHACCKFNLNNMFNDVGKHLIEQKKYTLAAHQSQLQKLVTRERNFYHSKNPEELYKINLKKKE